MFALTAQREYAMTLYFGVGMPRLLTESYNY